MSRPLKIVRIIAGVFLGIAFGFGGGVVAAALAMICLAFVFPDPRPPAQFLVAMCTLSGAFFGGYVGAEYSE